jgi:putative sterol carrier protein
MTADPAEGVESDRAVWLDLFRGACQGARVATAEDLATAAFVIRGTPAVWRRMLEGNGDPLLALVSGKLKLVRGRLTQLMPYARAAQELVITARGQAARLPPGWERA